MCAYFFIIAVKRNNYIVYADVAELADAPDLGSGVTDVQVQVLLSAFVKRLNPLILLGLQPF